MDFDRFKSFFDKENKDSSSPEAAAAAEQAQPQQTVSAVSMHADIFKNVSLQPSAVIPPAAAADQSLAPFAIPENLLAQPQEQSRSAPAPEQSRPEQSLENPPQPTPTVPPAPQQTSGANSPAGADLPNIDPDGLNQAAAIPAATPAAEGVLRTQPQNSIPQSAPAGSLAPEVPVDQPLPQEQQIQAAQYRPFEINYESRSPNYDELALERQSHEDADKISSINDKEVLPAGLTVTLYLRQLVAALFSHTTLSVLMPGSAMRFGPCYPSSMALPYLLTGIIAGLISASICGYADVKQLTGGLFLTVYVLLTGLTAFRGMAELICHVSRRYTDSTVTAVTVLLCGTLIIFTVCAIYSGSGPLEGAIIIALASMISACAASTLCFDIRQDPVDSFGTMSIKGLICCIVLVTAVSFVTLSVAAACSVVGLCLLLRLVLGQYFIRHNILASRPMICAVQLLLLIALLFDLMLLGIGHNLLSNMLYEQLSASHMISML